MPSQRRISDTKVTEEGISFSCPPLPESFSTFLWLLNYQFGLKYTSVKAEQQGHFFSGKVAKSSPKKLEGFSVIDCEKTLMPFVPSLHLNMVKVFYMLLQDCQSMYIS